jgi:hypothetical protein
MRASNIVGNLTISSKNIFFLRRENEDNKLPHFCNDNFYIDSMLNHTGWVNVHGNER